MNKNDIIIKWSAQSKAHGEASKFYEDKSNNNDDKIRSLKHEATKAVIDAILEDVESLQTYNELSLLEDVIQLRDEYTTRINRTWPEVTNFSNYKAIYAIFITELNKIINK